MPSSDDIRTHLGSIRDPFELIRGLFEHAPVPYAVFDGQGHCVLTNPAYRAMFGSAPPPSYSLLKDEVAASLGLGELSKAAYAGETVQTPTIWYDANALEHVKVEGIKRVAISCKLFPLLGMAHDVTHVAITYADLTAELIARAAAEKERDLIGEILHQSGDGIIVADRQGVIQIFNAEAERQHGVSRQHVNAEDWATTYGLYTLDGRKLPLAETPLFLALQGQRVHNASWLVRSPHNPPRLLSGTATPLRDEKGQVTGAVLITRDETQRTSAEQHLRLLAEASALLTSTLVYEETFARVARLLVPAFADWCVVDGLDVQGNLVHLAVVNALATDDALAEQARQLPLNALRESQAETFVSTLDDATGGLTFDEPDAVAFWRHVRPRSLIRVPLRARGRLLGSFTLVISHSARTFAPADLAAARELAARTALAADNARLYLESREQAERAERANRAKDNFMAVLGHELRNPLAPITTALEIIRLRHPEGDDREHTIIGRQVHHLRRLIDDLLDVSRITTGKVALQLALVPIVDLVNQAVELAAPLVAQRKHNLRVIVPNVPLNVLVDGTRMVQVLVNILTNAARYTPQGGSISIAIESVEQEAVVRIRDNGIGIAPEMLDHIFDLFVQAEQGSDRAQGGLGLGLNIARSLVALHGGKVTATSGGIGQGSEFVVSLPVSELSNATSTGAVGPLSVPKKGASKRIMLVDDNQDAADLLADLLRESGHTVTVSYDGTTALQSVAQFQPDIAFLDIGLPGMDGYELAAHLRLQPASADALLVALTGYGQESDKQRSLAAGFNLHLVKPVDLQKLQAVVNGDSE